MADLKQSLAVALAGREAQRPNRLRRRIRTSHDPMMRRRRAIVGLSLLGIGAMTPVTLYQSGLLRHLPDPPWRGFHSDKVNGSATAFGYGGPDAPLAIAAHAVNLMLATTGDPNRARHRPWLPVLAALLAGAQAAVAGRYLFYQMPKVDRAWCPYCITDAISHLSGFALTLPEAWQGLRRLLGR